MNEAKLIVVAKKPRRFFALSLVVLLGWTLISSGCGVLGESVETQLAQYEASGDPKALSKWLYRDGHYEREELDHLVEWSLSNRWRFIKLLDQLKGTKRDRFLAMFPEALAASNSYNAFYAEYQDSRSKTVQEILRLAKVN